MKFIPNAVSTTAARSLLKSQKASPQMLFAAGIIGFGATVVMACRSTLLLDEALEDIQKDLMRVDEFVSHPTEGLIYTEEHYKRDKAVIYLRSVGKVCKLYAPAIILGGLSVAALAGSHNILSKRNTSLIAAYGAVEKAFGQYRERVQSELGTEKEKELYYDLEKCEIDDPNDATGKKKKTVLRSLNEHGHSPYARLFSSETSSSYMNAPEYNLLFIRAQQSYANNILNSRGHVMLNDVYDGLGLERTSAGAVVGWIKDSETGDNAIDFGVLEGQAQDRFLDFMVGNEGGLWLDFNVDGIVYDKI